MSRKYILLSLVAGVSLVLDQLSKFWIRDNIPLGGRPIVVIDNYFRIVHAENKGAAWGILQDAEWRIPFFVVTTLIAIVVIGVYYYRLENNDRLQATGLSLILGGALGNFIDRVRFQSVTDFIEFYVGVDPARSWLISTFRSYRWPAFNVADAAIVAGIILILYFIFVIEPKLLAQEESDNEAKEAAAEAV